jgi:glycosyltransferase involved in cell wall biosynthesis
MPSREGRPLRVVQVSFHADTQRRDAYSLLRAWPTLAAVAGGVARAGVDVAVVQTAHADDKLSVSGTDLHFVRDSSPPRARVIDRVLSLAPDVVHVHGLHHGRAVLSLTRATRAPVFVQDHGNDEPLGWRRFGLRWAFRSIHGVAFTTREQAGPWIDCGALSADVPVFDVLESSSAFLPGDQMEAQRATGIFGTPCLVSTSRLDGNKDPLTMLEAVERAAHSLPNLRLWCCFGEAPLLPLVAAQIADSDVLRDRVVLLGARPHGDVEQLLRAADFYLQTSHREACGFSLLEAMACGTPPIVSDIPPARRIVGHAGSLTPVGDSAAMADAIISYSGCDRAMLRASVRARFESDLTFDAIGLQLRNAYQSLLESRAS